MARKKKVRSLTKAKPTNLQKLGIKLGKVNKMGVFDTVKRLSRHEPTSLQKLGNNLSKRNLMSVSNFNKKKKSLLDLV
jgi:hypothetical protein